MHRRHGGEPEACPRDAIRLTECAALIFDAPHFTSDWGPAMDVRTARTDDHIFRMDDIVITPTVAKFGPVSYQIASISSVAVYHRPRLNPIALTLVLAAAGLGILAYVVYAQNPDYGLWSALAAGVAFVLGVIWQKVRPVLEYRFVMKTAGSETETMTTFDRDQALELKAALESAFAIQLPQHEPETTIGRGAMTRADERDQDDLYITRDWIVANADLAPR
jgi:hypothetical protein